MPRRRWPPRCSSRPRPAFAPAAQAWVCRSAAAAATAGAGRERGPELAEQRALAAGTPTARPLLPGYVAGPGNGGLRLRRRVWLPPSTSAMLSDPRLHRIPLSQARRGDLMFYGSGHVEINTIWYPQTSARVARVDAVNWWRRGHGEHAHEPAYRCPVTRAGAARGEFPAARHQRSRPVPEPARRRARRPTCLHACGGSQQCPSAGPPARACAEFQLRQCGRVRARPSVGVR